MSHRPTDTAADPVIEAYRRGVDETLIVENLKLTVEQRFDRLAEQLRLEEELRAAVARAGRR